MAIEVFKTNVGDESQANELKAVLQRHFPASRVNFDMHDSDRVLRIEGADFTVEEVTLLVTEKGIYCSMLD